MRASLLLLVVLAGAGPHPQEATRLPSAQRIARLFGRGDYAAAAPLIEQFLEANPRDPAMLYRAACVYSELGERDRAASYLLRAVKAGWRNFDKIKRDAHLDGIRDHQIYQAILEAEERVTERVGHQALEQWRVTYGEEAYRYELDVERRLAYATALDEISHQEMRRMLERQADQLIEFLFEAPPSYSVLIAVPTPQDARTLFDNEEEGGIYEHHLRRLIARDIGRSLRHELVHAMHYGHMERLGQRHRLWIQEGLAALYEDYELDADGSVCFLPNERHNIVRSRARGGRLTPWPELFEMSAELFMAKASDLYPQARSIFEFVDERGKLARWYQVYVEHFDEDDSGALAFEVTFGTPVEDVERDWRRWVRSRPIVDTRIDSGDAALGIEAAPPNVVNDGVVIALVWPRSAAERSGLEAGDVIVSVDGRATRSLEELRAIIGTRHVGERVLVRARREGRYFTVVATLRPLVAR
jgi:hypothetical protein